MALQLEQSLLALQSRLHDIKAVVGELRGLVQGIEVSEVKTCYKGVPDALKVEDPAPGAGEYADRLSRLAKVLASPAAQLRAPETLEEVPMQLSLPEVAKLFLDHVPGMQRFVCQGRRGDYSLKRIQGAYSRGLGANGGEEEARLRLAWLTRLVVHHCRAGGPGSAELLRAVAEAFRGGEEAQAAGIESAGLRVRQAAPGLRGHLTKLADDHKGMALRALVSQSCARLDDGISGGIEHFRHQVLWDLGDVLGLNQADVHAVRQCDSALPRPPELADSERLAAMHRFFELFDIEAMLKAFVMEIRGPDAQTNSHSLASAFFEWAAERMPQYSLQEIEGVARSNMDQTVALGVFEICFLGHLGCSVCETLHEEWSHALFCSSTAEERTGGRADERVT
mmetsp:Transcript_27188/g.84598  ORF Transcript_27188/g.84598 Transcript_27188/m.84598 type:complete len:395 (-) Transcript_27188:154-1338(-)